ncbi:MAG TPA: hypothetical protein VF074_02085 [Pyrinomonadaceae bacterium]
MSRDVRRLVSICQRTSTALLALFLISTGVCGQDVLTRKPGESLGNFASRILPPDSELAHKVLVGSFGPSTKNVLLLFRPALASSNYTAWVLIPQNDSDTSYQKIVLPPMEEIPNHFDIAVSSVLYANADKDKELELIILYSYYRTGSGEEPGHAAYIYDWNGREFAILSEKGMKLVGLKTAAAVRRRLKALGY